MVRTVKDKNRALWESLRWRGSEAFSEEMLEPEPWRLPVLHRRSDKGKAAQGEGMPWRWLRDVKALGFFEKLKRHHCAWNKDRRKNV